MARLNRRRIAQPFGLVYQTPPEVCARVPEMREGDRRGATAAWSVRCGMMPASAPRASISSFVFDVDSADVWQKVFEARQRGAASRSSKRFNEEGIEFAYPTQTSLHRRAGRHADHALSA